MHVSFEVVSECAVHIGSGSARNARHITQGVARRRALFYVLVIRTMLVLSVNSLLLKCSKCKLAKILFVGPKASLPLLLNSRHFSGSTVAVDVRQTARENHRQRYELHLVNVSV